MLAGGPLAIVLGSIGLVGVGLASGFLNNVVNQLIFNNLHPFSLERAGNAALSGALSNPAGALIGALAGSTGSSAAKGQAPAFSGFFGVLGGVVSPCADSGISPNDPNNGQTCPTLIPGH